MKIINQELSKSAGYYLELELVDDQHAFLYIGRGFSNSKKDEKFKFTVDEHYVRLFVFTGDSEVQLKILEKDINYNCNDYALLVLKEVQSSLNIKDEFVNIIDRRIKENDTTE